MSSVSEATGSISVEVTKVGMNERPVAVAFSTQNGTATGTYSIYGKSDIRRESHRAITIYKGYLHECGFPRVYLYIVFFRRHTVGRLWKTSKEKTKASGLYDEKLHVCSIRINQDQLLTSDSGHPLNWHFEILASFLGSVTMILIGMLSIMQGM